MSGAPLLQQIRDATRELHARVEQLPVMARLLAPDLHADEYRAVLEKMWGFYAPLEARMRAPVTPEYAYAPRAPRIETDLAHLGRSTRSLPRCEVLPDLSTEPHTWGCLYVLEGASLGGRVILKHIARTQDVARERGATFFAGPDETGPHWKGFTSSLEAALQDDPGQQGDAVTTAVETFKTLHRWLTT